MTVPIISPEQRLSEPHGARILIVGPFGIGKTSLARELDPEQTLIVDIESGTLAIDDVPVPHVRPQTWPETRDLIVRIAGPNRSFQPHESYSQTHFDMVGGFLPGTLGSQKISARPRRRGDAETASASGASGLERCRARRSISSSVMPGLSLAPSMVVMNPSTPPLQRVAYRYHARACRAPRPCLSAPPGWRTRSSASPGGRSRRSSRASSLRSS